MDDFGRWTKTGLKLDISNISQSGINRIQQYANAAAGNVVSVNNQLPNNAGNVTLNTDNIPEGTNNLYATSTFLTNQLKNIMTTSQDMLIRDNTNNIVRLPKGANGQILTVNEDGDIEWAAGISKLNQLQFLSSMVRENFTIPANGTVNMLDWMMNTSTLFNDMVIPGDNVMPFVWGTRGDADYGQWQIGNQSNAVLNIDTANLVPMGIFIVFQFIRTLIANIMDDNLGDGTARVMVNGINANQTGGDAQIFNTAVSDLGKIRTLTEGTNITLTQNDDTITISSSGVTTLAALTDCNITTPNDLDFLRYDNASSKWKNVSITTDNISVGTTNKYYLDSLVSTYLLTVLTTSQDILYRNGTVLARLAKGANSTILSTNATGSLEWITNTGGDKALTDLTDVTITTPTTGQVLYKSAGDWINQSLDTSMIPENTNLYYTDTRVDTRLNTKYTAKGRIQVGTGNNTYGQQTAPGADFQVLVSDINNVLNNTGLSWAQMALNGSYFSNINIANPLNKQLLSYENATGKWINQTFDGSFALPLIAPNNTNYWGAANVPFQTQTPAVAGQCTGMGTRVGGGGLISFYVQGVEYFTVSPNFVGLSSNVPQMSIANGGSAAAPKLLFGTTGIGVFSNAGADRWNWGRQGATLGWIDATSLNTQSRLDIKNTLVDDYRMRINNVFNLFSFQNAGGTVNYLTVESGNNRVRMPNRFTSQVDKLEGAANLTTSITANNTFFNMSLGDATALTITNNAGSTGNITCVANTDEITINNMTGIKCDLNISFSMLLDKNCGVFEVVLWNMSDNVSVSSFHRRFRVDANYYFNYNCQSQITPSVAGTRYAIKLRSDQGATITAILTNFTWNISDLML